MIPDKIFINPIPKPSDGYVGIAWTEAHGDEYKVYIRKDALLRWAKEKQEQMKIEAGGCYNMLAAGKFLAFEEIIEKLNAV